MKSIFSASLTAIFATALFFATGCKEDTILRASVTPTGDNINGTEILWSNLDTRTESDDSVITSASSGSIYHTAAWLNADAYSGEISAGFYTQFVPPLTGWKIPAGYSIDSAVAIFPYSNFTWGDSTSTQPITYEAYKITDTSFKAGNTYFSKQELNRSATTIASSSYATKNLKDSVLVGGKKVAPHIRFQLDATTKNALIAAIDKDDTYPAFLNGFPGLYITVPKMTGPGNNLPYFRLNGTPTIAYSSASILLYARSSNGGKDTAFIFPFNPTYCGHFNHVERKFTGTALAVLNAALNSPQMLMHNEPGAAFSITIPNIQSLPKSIINKAELIIYEAPGTNSSIFFRPARLYPFVISSDGLPVNIADRLPLNSTAGLAFVDGNQRIDTILVGGNPTSVAAYHINIPRELQQALIMGRDSITLRINGVTTYHGAYRLVAGGKNAMDYAPKLRIVYTTQTN